MKVFTSATDISEFNLNYSGSAPDRFGATAFSFTAILSPGNLTHHEDASDYEAQRHNARAKFAYQTLSLERIWNFPRGVTLSTKFTGQVSSRNLLGSEQLGFGGYRTLRGYEESEYNADQGLIANVELRSPRFMLGKIGPDDDLRSYLQVLAFWDYGLARNHDLRPNEVTPDLSSVGVGARYNLGTHVSLRFDYGWRLERGFVRNDGGRMHIGVTISY